MKKIFVIGLMLSQFLMCSHGLTADDSSIKDKKNLYKDERIGITIGKYEGEELNGKAHGKGKVTNEIGDVFEGIFIRGEAEGKFIIKYSSGARFEGYLKQGLAEGKGKLVFSNGDVYEGG